MMNLLWILADVDNGTFLLPPQASRIGQDTDFAWNLLLSVTGFFFCIIVVAMIVFIIRFRRRTPDDVTSTITHNTPLEIMWTGIPLVLVLMFFYIGFKGFMNYNTPPSAAESTVVDVKAWQWNFQFTYPNGAQSDNLYVEKDKPVVLNMTSNDVLHGLYIPAFRVQRNLIPYRTTNLWFVATEYSPSPTKNDLGGFPLFCTQYCGEGHSEMVKRVYVLNAADYAEKMKELANPFVTKDAAGHSIYIPYDQVGKKFYSQLGCITCHSFDEAGSKIRGTGPSWWHLYKSDVTFSSSDVPGFAMHQSDSDEKWNAYLTESILKPSVKIVSSYQNVMPNFDSQLSGTEANNEKLRAIIAFIKSIGTEPYNPPYSPTKTPDLYNADKHPFHPESLAAQRAAASHPATQGKP